MMNIELSIEKLHNIVSKIKEVSLGRDGGSYKYKLLGNTYTYSISLCSFDTVEIKEGGVLGTSVFIGFNENCDEYTIKRAIEYCLFNRITNYEVPTNDTTMSKLDKIYKSIPALLCHLEFKFISVNPKTLKTNLHMGYILQFPDFESIILKSTKELNSYLEQSKAVISVAKYYIAEHRRYPVEVQLSTGFKLYGEETIYNNRDLTKWIVSHCGINTIYYFRWDYKYDNNHSVDYTNLPMIPHLYFTDCLKKFDNYSLLGFKLDNKLRGLLEIDDDRYTIVMEGYRYCLSKESLNTFYEDYIIQNHCDIGILRTAEALRNSLKFETVYFPEKTVNYGKEVILESRLNTIYKVYPIKLTFYINSDLDIEVVGELGNTKSNPTPYYMGMYNKIISDIVLYLIDGENITGEYITRWVECLKKGGT